MIANHRKQFGNKIRALRMEQGLTQEMLAEKAGLHSTYIGGIERGERNVAIDNIFKIAEAFKIDPAELFRFKEHDEKK